MFYDDYDDYSPCYECPDCQHNGNTLDELQDWMKELVEAYAVNADLEAFENAMDEMACRLNVKIPDTNHNLKNLRT